MFAVCSGRFQAKFLVLVGYCKAVCEFLFCIFPFFWLLEFLGGHMVLGEIPVLPVSTVSSRPG